MQLVNKNYLRYLSNFWGPPHIAVEYCLRLLSERPDEMDYVIRYLKYLDLPQDAIDRITIFMSSEEAIYDFQLFQLLRWFIQKRTFPPMLIELSRVWAFDRNREFYLRTYSLLALALAGNTSDLERIEELYGTATSKLEKAEIVVCMSRMEKGRRNRFYANAAGDSAIVKWAVDIVKQNDTFLNSIEKWIDDKPGTTPNGGKVEIASLLRLYRKTLLSICGQKYKSSY